MKYKITPFIVGASESPEARLVYLGDPEKLHLTINSFFLLQGEDKNILVDTGFSDEFCKKFTDGIKQEENQNPITQLKSVGVNPENIDEIILTHAHFDHFSDIVNECTNAKIHIQKKEYDFSLNPSHPWFQQFIDINLLKQMNNENRLNLIDGDCELFDGIKVITTAGHTVGHQSVIVDTEKGKFCITGDAVINYISLENDMGPGFNASLIECMDSLKRIKDLSNQGVAIIAGHDPKMLKHFPNSNYEFQKSEIQSPKSFCIIGHLKKECIEEYKEKHINLHLGPHKELLNVIKNSGIQDEKVFIHENMIVITFETEDLDKSYEIQGKSEILAKWNEIMKPMFDDRYEFSDNQSPFPMLEKVFDLNEQMNK